MRSQRWRFAWFVGLGFAVLSGCANMKLAGDSGTLGSPTVDSAASSSTDFDPASIQNTSPRKTKTAKPSSAERAKGRMIDSQLALGRLCERRGESEQATKIYMELLEKAPKDARPHHRLAVLAVQAGDFTKAEEHFGKAKSLASPTAELLSDLGYCYYLQHRLPEAESTLNEALRLDPAYKGATNNLALVLGRQGRFQESMELFKHTNTEAEAYANLAYVLAQNGQFTQAEQMYLRALTMDNRMKVAAQAMLQVNEHVETQDRLAGTNRGSTSNKSATEKMAVDKSTTEKPATNKTATNKTMADKLAADKRIVDKRIVDKPAAGKPNPSCRRVAPPSSLDEGLETLFSPQGTASQPIKINNVNNRPS